MKYLIIIFLLYALQSCHKEEEVVTVKNVDINNTFSITGKTIVMVNGENLKITFLRFDDYGTTGIQPPYTIVHYNTNTDAGSQDLAIFHYLRTEKMSLEKLDSISKNESSAGIGYFHERGDIDGKYALYFKNAYLSWDKHFKKDKMDYVRVDSARFILTKIQ